MAEEKSSQSAKGSMPAAEAELPVTRMTNPLRSMPAAKAELPMTRITDRLRRRFEKEISEIRNNTSGTMRFIEPSTEEANLLQWTVMLYPMRKPYNKGAFRVGIDFTHGYPFKAPRITVLTPIYHPNVQTNMQKEGFVCNCIFKDCWNPATRVEQMMSTLVELIEHPSGEHALRTDLWGEYVRDPATFFKNAEEFTEKYAEQRDRPMVISNGQEEGFVEALLAALLEPYNPSGVRHGDVWWKDVLRQITTPMPDFDEQCEEGRKAILLALAGATFGPDVKETAEQELNKLDEELQELIIRTIDESAKKAKISPGAKQAVATLFNIIVDPKLRKQEKFAAYKKHEAALPKQIKDELDSVQPKKLSAEEEQAKMAQLIKLHSVTEHFLQPNTLEAFAADAGHHRFRF